MTEREHKLKDSEGAIASMKASVLPPLTMIFSVISNLASHVKSHQSLKIKKIAGLQAKFCAHCSQQLYFRQNSLQFIILESDTLSSLFPNAYLNIAGLQFNSNVIFAIATALIVLPTAWLREFSLLNYISVIDYIWINITAILRRYVAMNSYNFLASPIYIIKCCSWRVVASVIVVSTLCWVGVVDEIGFKNEGGRLINWSGIPLALGLYGYCFSGHEVFPNLYCSLKKRSQYSSVLFTSFLFTAIMMGGTAIIGYMMFGESTLYEFTLNIPNYVVASKIAICTMLQANYT